MYQLLSHEGSPRGRAAIPAGAPRSRIPRRQPALPVSPRRTAPSSPGRNSSPHSRSHALSPCVTEARALSRGHCPRSPHQLRPRPAQHAASKQLPQPRPVPPLKPTLSSIQSDIQDTNVAECFSPVSRVQCARKEHPPTIEDTGEASSRDRSVSEAGRSRNITPRLGEASHSVRGPDSGRKCDSANVGPEPAGCEVTRLLRQLCGGDTMGTERVASNKNVQLLCVNGGSPRQPSTPQLLRILEETIQKKVPKSMYKKRKPKDAERLRLTFNIPDHTAENLFQYRTKFVQHMLTSTMYANSTIGKPWEIIGSISENIIDELLTKCAKEMEIQDYIQELYKSELA